MATHGRRLSMQNLLHSFSTRVTKKKKIDSTCWNFMQQEHISLFLYTCINSSYMTANMREVLVRAMCHFSFQICPSLWEFWTSGDTGRNLTVMGCRAVCRATAARSNLDGPVSQTHYEQQTASWIWMARVVSERKRVVLRALKTCNPHNNQE